MQYLKGNVESLTPHALTGWASVDGHPDHKVKLDLLLGDDLFQSTEAKSFRQDLADAGFGNGECAFTFTFDPPLSPLDLARLRLRLVGSALLLELPDAAARFAAAAAAGKANTALKVFIVGSPRSGTSVLSAVIQNAFNLPSPGESHVMPALAKAVYELRRHYEMHLHIPEDLLIKRLPVDQIEAQFCRAFRDFYLDAFGDGGWVDKTPSDEAIHGASLIHKTFPDAKLLVTRRNGIEVVDSYRKKFRADLEEAARNWVSAMSAIDRLTSAREEMLLLDQFDFTNRTAQTSTKIAEYLGRPDLAAAVATQLQSVSDDKLSSHDWTRQMTLAQMDWPEEEKALFAKICGEAMEKHGYKL